MCTTLAKSFGGYCWVAARARPLVGDAGQVTGSIVSLRDINDEVLARDALDETTQRFRLAMEAAPIGMAVVGLDRCFVEVNPKLCEMVDRDEEWLIGRSIAAVLNSQDGELDLAQRSELRSGLAAIAPSESKLVRADGATIWIEHSIGMTRDHAGHPASYVSIFVDITESRQVRRQLSFLATHDTLTHLANRRDLFDRADAILGRAQRTGVLVGILYIDVDHLKVVNERFGHAGGDLVLQMIADRLTASRRGSDLVARIGGDEFAVLLPGLRSISDAEAVAQSILEAVSSPFDIEGSLIDISVSIGVAIAQPTAGADRSLERADVALYQAKAAGRRQAVSFDPSRDDSVVAARHGTAIRSSTHPGSHDRTPRQSDTEDRPST